MIMAKENNTRIVLKDNIHELYLRKSLFWDVPMEKLDLNTNRRLIIERVFSRGNIQELKQLLNYYPEKVLVDQLKSIKSFDKKTQNFISKNFNLI
jgi:antitoxin HigA-1